jgi:hypothetical protein
MKMIATNGAAPITAYSQYLHNCLRNTKCEPSWSAPIPELPVLQLYVDFGAYKPVMYAIYLQDLCDLDHIEQVFPANYVVGQTPTGKWYGVFKYFHPPAINVTTFTAWLDVFVDAPGGMVEQTYFSEQMVVEPCQQLTKIKACQPAGATTTGFDVNGLYYGLPVNADYLGNNEVRYFHIAYVRMGHVKMLPPKVTYSSSLFRTFRSEVEQSWQLQGELVPQWYSLVLLAIYSRGALTVNDGDVRLVKELAYEAINDDDLTWRAYANLIETTRLYFGCDDSVCTECCSPILRSAVVGSHESASDASSSGDTFNNVLILDFDECWPTPAKGYQVQYRPIGGGAFRTWPVNFQHSPATIFTDADPAGTSYEGILRGDCGNGQFGVDVNFIAQNPDSASSSASGSSSSSGPCSPSLDWTMFVGAGAAGSMVIKVNGIAQATAITTSSGSVPVVAGDVVQVNVISTGTRIRALDVFKNGTLIFGHTGTTTQTFTFTVTDCDAFRVGGSITAS